MIKYTEIDTTTKGEGKEVTLDCATIKWNMDGKSGVTYRVAFPAFVDEDHADCGHVLPEDLIAAGEAAIKAGFKEVKLRALLRQGKDFGKGTGDGKAV